MTAARGAARLVGNFAWLRELLVARLHDSVMAQDDDKKDDDKKDQVDIAPPCYHDLIRRGELIIKDDSLACQALPFSCGNDQLCDLVMGCGHTSPLPTCVTAPAR